MHSGVLLSGLFWIWRCLNLQRISLNNIFNLSNFWTSNCGKDQGDFSPTSNTSHTTGSCTGSCSFEFVPQVLTLSSGVKSWETALALFKTWSQGHPDLTTEVTRTQLIAQSLPSLLHRDHWATKLLVSQQFFVSFSSLT